MTPSFSLAIVGTRGVPPRYGGFETFAAELGRRLVARGHRVTVYCRRSLYPDGQVTWEGIRRIELPALKHKYLETVSHALLSSLDALRRDYQVVLVCNAANAFVLPILRAGRLPVAINVDGIERKRRKWNQAGRAVYAVGESLSVSFSSALIADAEVIADYYRRQFGIEPEVLTYGSEFPTEVDSNVLARLALQSKRFLLYVSRFEPENNPLEVLLAYRKVRTDWPLVMLGAAPYAPELARRLEEEGRADRRVILPGALYGLDYRTLQRHAGVYIQATEVGGTHPALIEAMGAAGAILANDTAENREVGADSVLYFRMRPQETLSTLLQQVLDTSGMLNVYRQRSLARSRSRYSWEGVVDGYERLFLRMTGQAQAGGK